MSRYDNIDIIKGIAIILVVVGHQVHLFQPAGWSVSDWVNGFHLPLFMFAGGFIALKTVKPTIKTINGWLQYILKRSRGLLLPYAVWSIFVYPIVDGSLSINFFASLYNYFITPPGTVLWFLHTYFILSLVFSLYYLIIDKVKLFQRFLPNIIVVGFLYIICILLNKAFSVIPYNLIAFFPYYFLGVLFAKFSFLEKYSKNAVVLSLLFILFFICSLHYQRNADLDQAYAILLKVFLGCSASIVFYHLTNFFQFYAPIRKLLILFGQQSLIIYIVHFMLLLELSTGFPELSNYWLFVIGLVLALIIGYTCIVIGALISKIPLLDSLLFGRKVKFGK